MDKITESYNQLTLEQKKELYQLYFDKQVVEDLRLKAEAQCRK